MTCAPCEDSDQPGHPPSLIRAFAVCMTKAWVLSYPLSAQRRLIKLGGCPGWSESSLRTVVLFLSWGGSYAWSSFKSLAIGCCSCAGAWFCRYFCVFAHMCCVKENQTRRIQDLHSMCILNAKKKKQPKTFVFIWLCLKHCGSQDARSEAEENIYKKLNQKIDEFLDLGNNK